MQHEISQHTAHERIWYEKLGHLQPLDGPQQGLLVPEIMEFSLAQAAVQPCNDQMQVLPKRRSSPLMKSSNAVPLFWQLIAGPAGAG